LPPPPEAAGAGAADQGSWQDQLFQQATGAVSAAGGNVQRFADAFDQRLGQGISSADDAFRGALGAHGLGSIEPDQPIDRTANLDRAPVDHANVARIYRGGGGRRHQHGDHQRQPAGMTRPKRHRLRLCVGSHVSPCDRRWIQSPLRHHPRPGGFTFHSRATCGFP